MALYRVHFYDFGDNVIAVHDIDCDDDESAIIRAHELNVLPHMTGAFEVWDGDRIVHRHKH